MVPPLTYLDVFPHHVEAHLQRLLQVPDHRLLTWRGQDTIRPVSLVHGKYYDATSILGDSLLHTK